MDLPKDKKTGNKANAVPSVKKVPETQPKTSGSAQIKEAKKSSTNNTAEEKKPKKVGTPKGKKTLKDEDEQSANSMFEINNRFYIQGNRTLNNLNLCGNSITEYGLQILLNVTLEQDVCAENGNEIGLFKIPLQVFPE